MIIFGYYFSFQGQNWQKQAYNIKWNEVLESWSLFSFMHSKHTIEQELLDFWIVS